jgi:DNA-binding transcriptional ArsR family regulator
MVEQLDATFTALADPTRRDILARLSRGETSVGELAEPYAMSLNAVSKHLKTLEKAQLVTRRVEGRVHHIRLNPAPLRSATEWLEVYRTFWDGRLDALETFLARKRTKQETGHGSRDPHHAHHPRPKR